MGCVQKKNAKEEGGKECTEEGLGASEKTVPCSKCEPARGITKRRLKG